MEQIGRYQILGELGRGAMGVVYKALDPTIGRTIAIKSIPLLQLTSDTERDRLRERLVREAQSAGVLSHPGIVTIYDIAEENGTAHIFMEYVPGQPLEKLLLAKQPPDRETLLSIFRQTASALDYAHRKGIVHRDIKPANIMIHEDGSAKITDFGVAKIMSQQLTQAGTMMGTPSYMSPEQVQGIPVDGRADQFGLAVIAYEVLTGEKPFLADYLPTLLYKIVREDPMPASRLNNTLGPAVESVLTKALSKLPDDRYDTCSEFIATLSAACNASHGWVPLPRGASHELPTAGSGERTASPTVSTIRPPMAPGSRSTFNEGIQTVADNPPALYTPPPFPQAPPQSPSPAISQAGPPPLPLPVPSFEPAPPQHLAIDPQSAERYTPPVMAIDPAPSEHHTPPMLAIDPTPMGHPQNLSDTLTPRVAPVAVERRLGADPLEAEGRSSHAFRNVLLSAAVIALAFIAIFVWMQRYNVQSDPSQTPSPIATNQPTIPSPPPAANPVPPPPATNDKPPETEPAKPPETAANTPPPVTEPVPDVAPEPPKVKTMPQKRPATEKESSFQLTTSPAGAVAVFDGDPGLQCVSPCKITLPAGRHTLALHHAGYRDAQRIIETPRDPGLIVDLTMLSGIFSVSSSPAGLGVIIDGKEQARKTPLSISLPVGRHHVEIVKGTERQAMDVEIQDGALSSKHIDWNP